MRRFSQSIWDQLVKLMPSLQDNNVKKNQVDVESAKKLFSIWRDDRNKITNNIYKRPITLSLSDIDAIQKEGLVVAISDKIEITKKGYNVIKVMILGDERSSFEDTGIIIDHNKALANTRSPSIKSAKLAQRYEDLWWRQFEDGKKD